MTWHICIEAYLLISIWILYGAAVEAKRTGDLEEIKAMFFGMDYIGRFCAFIGVMIYTLTWPLLLLRR